MDHHEPETSQAGRVKREADDNLDPDIQSPPAGKQKTGNVTRADNKGKLSTAQTTLNRVEGGVNAVKSVVSGFTESNATVLSEMSKLSADMAELKGTHQPMSTATSSDNRSGMAEMKSEIAGLKADLAKATASIAEMEEKLARDQEERKERDLKQAAEIADLKETQTRGIDAILNAFTQMKDSLAAAHDRPTSPHEQEQAEPNIPGNLPEDKQYVLHEDHAIGFGDVHIWFLNKRNHSVTDEEVSEETATAVDALAKQMASIVKDNPMPESICLQVNKSKQKGKWEDSNHFAYYACDWCRKKNQPCIRQAVEGFTVRPIHGAGPLRWIE